MVGGHRLALLRRPPGCERRLAALAVLALALVGARPGDSRSSVPLPPSLQVALVHNVLSFDRRLPARAGREIVIGVLHQQRVREAEDLAHDLLAAAAADPYGRVSGLPCRWTGVELGEGDELGPLLESHQVDILYVAPLRALDPERVGATSRERRLLSVTGVAGYVGRGVAVGLTLRGERPQILVDLAAAQAAGAELDAQLLKLATLVRGAER